MHSFLYAPDGGSLFSFVLSPLLPSPLVKGELAIPRVVKSMSQPVSTTTLPDVFGIASQA